MKKTPTLIIVAVVLIAGCAADGPLPNRAERFSIDMVQKDDPSKSYGEALFDMISEGSAQRRVLGWIDRAT
jgi:hypothetical protein